MPERRESPRIAGSLHILGGVDTFTFPAIGAHAQVAGSLTFRRVLGIRAEVDFTGHTGMTVAPGYGVASQLWVFAPSLCSCTAPARVVWDACAGMGIGGLRIRGRAGGNITVPAAGSRLWLDLRISTGLTVFLTDQIALHLRGTGAFIPRNVELTAENAETPVASVSRFGSKWALGLTFHFPGHR